LTNKGVLGRGRNRDLRTALTLQCIRCHRPNVLSPQVAAAANAARKTKPVTRCESEFLLQAWSTAMSQTKKSPIAVTARVLMSIPIPLYRAHDAPGGLSCAVRAVTRPDHVSSLGSSFSYPRHCSTGKRGYLGKDGSVAERSQRKNVEPRSDFIRRMKRQSAQRPTRDSLANGVFPFIAN
jgi:hypothetical protein